MSTLRFTPRPAAVRANGIPASGVREVLAPRTRRRSFTLVEMLTVVTIIGILASTVLFALFKATQEAKTARTKAQIQRLHQLVMTRWETYRTRPIRITSAGLTAQQAAKKRLDALHELMRLEMPERVSDVVNPATYVSPNGLAFPALARHYWRVSNASTSTWAVSGKTSYQGAECLYLIVASIRENGTSGLDFLQPGEIGDVDGDGMPEILDAWGHPIEFLRWAPGYVALPGPDGQWGVAGTDDDGNSVKDDFSERLWTGSDDLPGLSTLMNGDPKASPDPFDPLHVYSGTFALYPLILSAGPDGLYDIAVDTSPTSLDYGVLNPQNNPYYVPSAISGNKPMFAPMGTAMDANGDGELSYADNITSHFMEAK